MFIAETAGEALADGVAIEKSLGGAEFVPIAAVGDDAQGGVERRGDLSHRWFGEQAGQRGQLGRIAVQGSGDGADSPVGFAERFTFGWQRRWMACTATRDCVAFERALQLR